MRSKNTCTWVRLHIDVADVEKDSRERPTTVDEPSVCSVFQLMGEEGVLVGIWSLTTLSHVCKGSRERASTLLRLGAKCDKRSQGSSWLEVKGCRHSTNHCVCNDQKKDTIEGHRRYYILVFEPPNFVIYNKGGARPPVFRFLVIVTRLYSQMSRYEGVIRDPLFGKDRKRSKTTDNRLGTSKNQTPT